jgi:hypothetical protein
VERAQRGGPHRPAALSLLRRQPLFCLVSKTGGPHCSRAPLAASASGSNAARLTRWLAYELAALRIFGVQLNKDIGGVISIGATNELPQDAPRPSLTTLITMVGI